MAQSASHLVATGLSRGVSSSELPLFAHERLQVEVKLGELPSAVPPHRHAVLVKEEDAGEVPLYLTWKGGLGRLPDGIGLRPVHLHLCHEMAPAARSRQAFALDEGRDLLRRQFLSSELIAGKQQDVEVVLMLRVPRLQLTVDAVRCASSGSHVEHEDWLSRKRAHGELITGDRLARVRVD